MEDQFMSYLTCEACRYTFVSDKDLIQCPDCGKPQVRKATEKEIDDYIRIRMEIEKRIWGNEKLGGRDDFERPIIY